MTSVEMKLAVAAFTAAANVMFASADHKASPERRASCSVEVQAEAVSNQYVTVLPGVPGIELPHFAASDWPLLYVAGLFPNQVQKLVAAA
jgi:hypothetical protein